MQRLEGTLKRRTTAINSNCFFKVRCEFLGDNDFVCKRCLQAGQECVIPDRKPRRRPPYV